MVIDKKILDELTEAAKASPRLRMNYDLRNSAEDRSQRMLNAIEPGTVMPIHRHRSSSETVDPDVQVCYVSTNQYNTEAYSTAADKVIMFDFK